MATGVLSIHDVIEYNGTKHRFLVVEVIPYNILIRNIWGHYDTIGKRRSSEFTKIGVKPEHIQRWKWSGTITEKRKDY